MQANASQIYGVYAQEKCKMCDGTKAKKGDIVICSVNDKNFTDPCVLGKVFMVKDVNLGPTHNDGEKGQIYVIPYDKQNIRGRMTLAQLKSLLSLACLTFVLEHFVVHVCRKTRMVVAERNKGFTG